MIKIEKGLNNVRKVNHVRVGVYQAGYYFFFMGPDREFIRDYEWCDVYIDVDSKPPRIVFQFTDTPTLSSYHVVGSKVGTPRIQIRKLKRYMKIPKGRYAVTYDRENKRAIMILDKEGVEIDEEGLRGEYGI